MKKLFLILVMALAVAISAFAVPSSVPATITYQGRLLSSGTVVDGNVTMRFALYDAASSGTKVWPQSASYEEQIIDVDNGLYTAYLGNTYPFSSELFNTALYLEVTVNGTTLTPRTQLMTTPYSYYSGIAKSVDDGAISTSKLVDGAVTSAKIFNGTIVNDDVSATAAIAGSKIDPTFGSQTISGSNGITITGTVSLPNDAITDAMVVNALTISGGTINNTIIGGTTAAAGTFTNITVSGTVALPTGSIETADIADNGITAQKIADDAVTAAKINADVAGLGLVPNATTGALDVNVDGSTLEINTDALRVKDLGISTAKLAEAVVTETKLASNSVTSAKITNGTIATEDIADGAITTDKLVDESVIKATLAPNSVTTEKIDDGTIIGEDLKSDITITTTGNIIANAGEFTSTVSGADPVNDDDFVTKGYLASEINGLNDANQTALDDKVDKNSPITGATKTKITYDAKGLVTAGADLVESDIPELNYTKITGLGSLATQDHIGNEDWTGDPLSIVNGGTGATDIEGIRNNLQLGALAVEDNITDAMWSGAPLSILHGGTGATTAEGARSALGLATVASTGAYSDLTGVPTNVSDFSNDANYLTALTLTELDPKVGALTAQSVPVWDNVNSKLVDGAIKDDGTNIALGTSTINPEYRLNVVYSMNGGGSPEGAISATSTNPNDNANAAVGMRATANTPGSYAYGLEARANYTGTTSSLDPTRMVAGIQARANNGGQAIIATGAELFAEGSSANGINLGTLGYASNADLNVGVAGGISTVDMITSIAGINSTYGNIGILAHNSNTGAGNAALYAVGNTVLQGNLTVSSGTVSLPAGEIGTSELANDAVTNAKLADNAVQTENIANGTILGEDLKSDITITTTGNIIANAGEFTSTVSGADPVNNDDFVTKGYYTTGLNNLSTSVSNSINNLTLMIDDLETQTNQEIDLLNTYIQSLTNDVNTIETNITTINNNISNLESDLENQIDFLTQQVQDGDNQLAIQINQLSQQVQLADNDLETQINQLTQQVQLADSDLQDQIDVLSTNLGSITLQDAYDNGATIDGATPVAITGAGLDVSSGATYNDAIDAKLVNNNSATPQAAIIGTLDGTTDYYGILGGHNPTGTAGVIGSKSPTGPYGLLGATVDAVDYAGYFGGNVKVTSNISAVGGAFTSTVSGLDPVNDDDFVTKGYLATEINGLNDAISPAIANLESSVSDLELEVVNLQNSVNNINTDILTLQDNVTNINTALDGKVDKVTGYSLTKNDFTDLLKSKLDGIEEGAEANVQADWNQTTNTADDYIKNKPTKVSDFENDADYLTALTLTELDPKVGALTDKTMPIWSSSSSKLVDGPLTLDNINDKLTLTNNHFIVTGTVDGGANQPRIEAPYISTPNYMNATAGIGGIRMGEGANNSGWLNIQEGNKEVVKIGETADAGKYGIQINDNTEAFRAGIGWNAATDVYGVGVGNGTTNGVYMSYDEANAANSNRILIANAGTPTFSVDREGDVVAQKITANAGEFTSTVSGADPDNNDDFVTLGYLTTEINSLNDAIFPAIADLESSVSDLELEVVNLQNSVNNINTDILTLQDNVTNINTELDGKVDKNDPIIAGTKTKITYDAKGLVTAGEDLAETDIPSEITRDTELATAISNLNLGTMAIQNANAVAITGGSIIETDIGLTGTPANAKFVNMNANSVTLPTDAITNAMVVDALTISGGTINATPIGETTPSTGAFTDISATGTVSLPNGSITDDMVANDLTISGGDIDATPIGFNTPSTGAFTSLVASNSFTLGSGVTNYTVPVTRGTASQVLRMNSGANALEWVTDDFVKLSDANTWTNTQTIDVSGQAADNVTGLFVNQKGNSPAIDATGDVSITSGNVSMSAGNLTLSDGHSSITNNSGIALYVKQNALTYGINIENNEEVGANVPLVYSSNNWETGNAGVFGNYNASNNTSALIAESYGTGAALEVYAGGTGLAADIIGNVDVAGTVFSTVENDEQLIGQYAVVGMLNIAPPNEMFIGALGYRAQTYSAGVIGANGGDVYGMLGVEFDGDTYAGMFSGDVLVIGNLIAEGGTFSSAVTGVLPTLDNHLATKAYVDNAIDDATVTLDGTSLSNTSGLTINFANANTWTGAQTFANLTATGTIDFPANSLEMSDISGLASALNLKADASHTHIIDDITGLQTALDAKAPTNSPTFTGVINGDGSGITNIDPLNIVGELDDTQIPDEITRDSELTAAISALNLGTMAVQNANAVAITGGSIIQTDIGLTGTPANAKFVNMNANSVTLPTDAITDAMVVDALTISGGTINNTPIGATSASTGAFTNLSVSGTVTIGNNKITDAMVVNALTISGGQINNTPIGSSTPTSGKFTTLNPTSTVTFGTGATNYVFPTTRGTNGQILVTNGSGILAWETPASSLSLSDANTWTNTQTIDVSGQAANDITGLVVNHKGNNPAIDATGNVSITSGNVSMSAGNLTLSNGHSSITNNSGIALYVKQNAHAYGINIENNEEAGANVPLVFSLNNWETGNAGVFGNYNASNNTSALIAENYGTGFGLEVAAGGMDVIGVSNITTDSDVHPALSIGNDGTGGGLYLYGGAEIEDGITLTGNLTINDSDGNYTTSFATGDQSADITYTLPTTAPTDDQVLTSDASGVLSWADAAGGSMPAGTTNNAVMKYSTGTNTWVEEPNITFPATAFASVVITNSTLGNYVGAGTSTGQTIVWDGTKWGYNDDLIVGGDNAGMTLTASHATNAAFTVSNDLAGKGLTVSNGGVLISQDGLTVSAGGASITGESSVTVNSFNPTLTISNTGGGDALSVNGGMSFDGDNPAIFSSSVATQTLRIDNSGSGKGLVVYRGAEINQGLMLGVTNSASADLSAVTNTVINFTGSGPITTLKSSPATGQVIYIINTTGSSVTVSAASGSPVILPGKVIMLIYNGTSWYAINDTQAS